MLCDNVNAPNGWQHLHLASYPGHEGGRRTVWVRGYTPQPPLRRCWNVRAILVRMSDLGGWGWTRCQGTVVNPSHEGMATKTDVERVGFFSESGYTTIGDPYVSPTGSKLPSTLGVLHRLNRKGEERL